MTHPRRSVLALALATALALGEITGIACTAGPPTDHPAEAPPNPESDAVAMPFVLRGNTGGYAESTDDLLAQVRAAAPSAEDLPAVYDSGVFRGNPYLEKLPFDRDAVIADIGAGTGALEVEILSTDRPFRRLYAVDIDPKATAFVEKLLASYFPRAAEKITVVTSSVSDVRLPEGAVDLAVMVNAHFYVPRFMGDENARTAADACLASLRRAMKADGRVHVFQSFYISREEAANLPDGADNFRRDELAGIREVFERAGFTAEAADVDRGCNCYRFVLAP
ncbi:MAG: class I SAM-dependent methyltransferase [Deltaproteobacteria bacterium]|nr:class I SAM-dependent methyltransferase [Deltaproteobacteria bacterium]